MYQVPFVEVPFITEYLVAALQNNLYACLCELTSSYLYSNKQQSINVILIVGPFGWIFP